MNECTLSVEHHTSLPLRTAQLMKMNSLTIKAILLQNLKYSAWHVRLGLGPTDVIVAIHLINWFYYGHLTESDKLGLGPMWWKRWMNLVRVHYADWVHPPSRPQFIRQERKRAVSREDVHV